MKESEKIMNKTEKNFQEAYVDNGVVRWVSSNNVPFDDMLTEFLIAGFISQEDVIASMNARKADEAKFLEQYIANRRKFGYSDEEKFEMRAAFGDEEVIDIFTGEMVDYA